jgi:DNA-binding beta-propeller fold protein YncE
MKILDAALALGAIAAGAALPADAGPVSEAFGAQHAVFVMTNDAESNEVIVYERAQYGALHPPGSANLDIAVSADGAYLYSLNAASGAIGIFQIQQDGRLTNFGTVGGLPAGAGLNGIAAN